MSEQENREMRELLSLLTSTVTFIGKETANLVRDKAARAGSGNDGVSKRAEQIDEAVKKLESAARHAALRIVDVH